MTVNTLCSAHCARAGVLLKKTGKLACSCPAASGALAGAVESLALLCEEAAPPPPAAALLPLLSALPAWLANSTPECASCQDAAAGLCSSGLRLLPLVTPRAFTA
jgi:hypothetical protein